MSILNVQAFPTKEEAEEWLDKIENLAKLMGRVLQDAQVPNNDAIAALNVLLFTAVECDEDPLGVIQRLQMSLEMYKQQEFHPPMSNTELH